MQLQSGQNIPLTSSSITLNLRYPVRPAFRGEPDTGNDSNLLIVFYVQIMPDDLVMQLHRF